MTTLTAELRASVEAERIVKRVTALRGKLPKATYRKMVNRIADLQRSEEIEEQANDINPKTGHMYACGCRSCMTVNGLAF